MILGSIPFTPEADALRWIATPGAGDPVLFVHGLGCHGAASWMDAAIRLRRSSVIVDLPGHGRSDRPRTYDYSLTSAADALAEVITSVNAGPVDVVSHSLGGTLAIVLASRHPELIRRSVLVEPAIDPFPVEPGSIAYLSDEEMLAGGWDDVLARELDWRRADMQLADPIAILQYARHLASPLEDTVHGLLTRTQVPTTLVLGELRTYRAGDEFASAGVEVIRVPGAQHFVMHDQPEAFAEVLATALA